MSERAWWIIGTWSSVRLVTKFPASFVVPSGAPVAFLIFKGFEFMTMTLTTDTCVVEGLMDTVVQTSGELVLVFGSYWKSFSAFGVLWSGIDIYCKWLITSRIRRVRSVSCGLLAFSVGFG